MGGLRKIHESKYGGDRDNFHLSRMGQDVIIDLTYPPGENDPISHQARYIQIGLEHVRASDGVRVSYHFYRNGWVIEQPRTRLVPLGKDSYDSVEEWFEVGFFPSWALHDETTDESPFDFDDALLHVKQAPRKFKRTPKGEIAVADLVEVIQNIALPGIESAEAEVGSKGLVIGNVSALFKVQMEDGRTALLPNRALELQGGK